MLSLRHAALMVAVVCCWLEAPTSVAFADSYWSETRRGAAVLARRASEKLIENGDRVLSMESDSDTALRMYGQAIVVDPTFAEPHFRRGWLLAANYVCAIRGKSCESQDEKQRAEEIIDHWSSFRRLAPDDPRSEDLLFDIAMLHVKIGTPEHVRAAQETYELMIERLSLLGLSNQSVFLMNLAEAWMMQGDLDTATIYYRRALDITKSPSVVYGLAVALDRSGRTREAHELITSLGVPAAQEFEQDVRVGRTFYVPEGETYYYIALIAEALGDKQEAKSAFAEFIRSGAHPQYQAAAQNRPAVAPVKLPSKTQTKTNAKSGTRAKTP